MFFHKWGTNIPDIPDCLKPLQTPTAKTVREVRLEEQVERMTDLLRECLPLVAAWPMPTEKTIALIERVTKEIA